MMSEGERLWRRIERASDNYRGLRLSAYDAHLICAAGRLHEIEETLHEFSLMVAAEIAKEDAA